MASLPIFLTEATAWVSFCFSLMIFSLLFGDNLLSRLAQYILVGISIGYLGAAAIQHVLRPRLFAPLMNSSPTALAAGAATVPWDLWIVLLLGLLMVVAGMTRILGQQTATARGSRFERPLQWAGMIPAALVLGVGVAVVFIGVMQGTFWPLFWHTVHSGLNWSDSVGRALSSVLILLLTTATLLVWTVPVAQTTQGQPTWVRLLIRWWAAIGKRALWFAGGILFARLLAAHVSLLIARITFFLDSLSHNGLWQWAALIWRGVFHR